MEKLNLVKRTKRTKNFSIIDNEILTSTTLSFGAKGLLCYVLSLPDDWVLHKTYIQKTFDIGRDALSTLFKELEKEGFLIAFDMIHLDNGRWHGKNYLFYDTPQNQETIKKVTDAGFPSTAEPSAVEPSTANPPLISTNNKKELKKVIINREEGNSPSNKKNKNFNLTEQPTQEIVFKEFDGLAKRNPEWAQAIASEKFKFYWYYDARKWTLAGGMKISEESLRGLLVTWMHKAEQFNR